MIQKPVWNWISWPRIRCFQNNGKQQIRGDPHHGHVRSSHRSRARLPLQAARAGTARHAGHRDASSREDHRGARGLLAHALVRPMPDSGDAAGVLGGEAGTEQAAQPADTPGPEANGLGGDDGLGVPNAEARTADRAAARIPAGAAPFAKTKTGASQSKASATGVATIVAN